MAREALEVDGLPAAGRPRRRLGGQGLTGAMFVRRGQATALTEAPPGNRTAQRDRFYRRFLAVGDVLVAIIALSVAIGWDDLRVSTVLVPILLVLTFKVVGLYDADLAVMRRSTLDEVPRLLQISGLFALLAWLLGSCVSDTPLDRSDVLALWAIFFVGVSLARGLARAVARAVAPPECCAIVGDAESIARVRERLAASRVKAEIVATLPVGPGPPPAALGDPEAFTRFLSDGGVERLIVAPFGSDGTETLDLVRIAKAAGVRVSLLPRLMEVLGSSVEFEELDGMTMMGVRPLGLSRSSLYVKRTVDLAGAAVGVLAAAPILVAVAIAVRLDSAGPIFFRQMRVGRDGKHFQMLKFRSMVDGAESQKAALLDHNETAGIFKMAEDPRITRVGRWLRRTSLDELPQLLNVLRGEMSLVGPRPLVLEEDAQVLGLDRTRLHLTPGMTGPWQVLGPVRVPLREMVAIDYLYVANWSLWRDLEILVRTAAHVVRRRGV